MGTRSLTVFIDKGKEIAVLYRQFDGYYDGHGKELITFLKNKKIVNGFTDEDMKNLNFNGMACLAASVIAHFKTEIGGFYLYAAGTRDCGEDYIYSIEDDFGNLRVTMKEVYSGKERVILGKKIPNTVTIPLKSVSDLRALLFGCDSKFTVIFTKKDGTLRKMEATLGEEFQEACEGLKKNHTFHKANQDNGNYLSVYDLEKEGFRKVNMDTISYIKIGNVEYVC